MNLWDLLLVQPLLNALLLFYHILFSNLGLAIIGLTIVIKAALLPVIIPSMRSMQKMKDLAPEIAKLKKRHEGDKTKLMQAQADLYKSRGVNPAAGCLPQIVQLVVLIALFQVFIRVLPTGGIEAVNKLAYTDFLKITSQLNTHFLNLDLSKPDIVSFQGIPIPLPGVFLLTSALLQLLGSKMMMPEVKEEEKIAQKTPSQADDMAVAMQKQSLYLFPLLTLIAGINFASGLVLYWTASSLAQAVQQYYISGWGGLSPWLRKVNLIK